MIVPPAALDEPNPEGNPALAAATEAILSRRLASSSGCGVPQARRAALLLDVLPDAAAALEAAAPHIREAERERCAQLAETHGATYPALAPIGPGEGTTIGSGHGYQQVPFAPLLREGPS